MIAEVGAWSNPLSPDSETSRKAIVLCQARLRLADRIGAIGGINFKITDKIAVKGQVEYANQQTLFSIGAGYTF